MDVCVPFLAFGIFN